ncbi:hypothetical protein STAFG_4253 [Streptomyces afghaniensis 772]|uniref:Uncharacterized protein n=1 Tax=Streptomyces afghaniensis 772 TaxID=1283301 RepID=S4MXS2_9ACTN|nr:hypothetical protein STAFG_4253 [Streptomyces afghaniensis 772]
MGLYAAMILEFISADAPHRPDDPASGWHWEPKEAFHAVARRYGAAGHR